MNHIRPAWQSALKEWLSVLSALQARSAESHKQRGHAIVRVIVVVDSDGNPVVWSKPSLTKLEPFSRTGDFLEEILKSLSE